MWRAFIFLILALGLAIPSYAATVAALPTFHPAAERIIAIGDLHGDFESTRKVFSMAGITGDQDQWIAEDLVVVQTGDQLDRGDEEQEILEFLARLQKEAAAAGGALHLLNGNHELMNVRLDLRYVTEGGFADFHDAVVIEQPDSLLLAFDPEKRGRVAAFRPGGPYAMMLAERNTILMIGDNVFVHGGVLPQHVSFGLEKLNREIQLWIAGEGPEPQGIHKRESPTWTRIYSDNPTDESCLVLDEVLDRLGASRMIVGHTVQDDGITPHCNDRVWCIDSGLAAYYGSSIAALEIIGNEVRVILP